MKENGIMVDFEWAYQEVTLSHDLTRKRPEWVNAFVEGWREGYLKGFLNGWTEGKINTLYSMKQSGMSSDMIASCTNLSIDVVKKIVEGDDKRADV